MAGSVGQYTMGWFPWVAVKSSVGSWVRTNNTGSLGMGYWDSSAGGAQNDEFVVPLYLDSVTWKWATVYWQDTASGIVTVTHGAQTLGTQDQYGTNGQNQYAEITSISITTPQAADLTMKMATKNASSTGYRGIYNSIALIRTAGTPSTPAGTDTPGYTWELAGAWMGVKASSGTWARSQASSKFAGGSWNNAGSAASGDYSEWDIWLDAGTFTFSSEASKSTDSGIWDGKLDGTSKGTVDAYASPSTENNYLTITGASVSAPTTPVTFRLTSTTKNASSSAYGMYPYSLKWTRTGA